MNVEMSEQEINTTMELLNIAIKTGGYNTAKPAVYLIDKFVALLPKENEEVEVESKTKK